MKDLTITYTVTTGKEHEALLKEVDTLMKKGEENTTPEENARILAMAEAIMAYEHSIYEIPEPSSLESILEVVRYEMMCKGQDLAETLGVSQDELQMIIDGDKKPDTALLEVIKEKLDIPVELIMNHA